MIQLTVNGSVKQYDGDPAMPVLWYLRDLLELTGAKFGCGMGLCGCLHRARRRQSDAQLRHQHERRRWQAHHHHRRAQSEWRPSSAKGLAGGQRAAVRLLSEPARSCRPRRC